MEGLDDGIVTCSARAVPCRDLQTGSQFQGAAGLQCGARRPL